MEPKKETGFLLKVVVVSAVTAILVFFLLAVIMAVVYYQFCCEPIGRGTPADGDGVTDRIERADRTGTSSTTDAAKITSISVSAWTHVGPLYPGPKDPPGYVSSRSVTFQRDLSAVRKAVKDYDRDLPNEEETFSASLTPEQFEKLAAICAGNDIINEPNSKEVRSEGNSTLVIEYDGQKRSIVTSNIGIDTANVKAVLAAIEDLEKKATWTPARSQ